jgi:hypothetical protein
MREGGDIVMKVRSGNCRNGSHVLDSYCRIKISISVVVRQLRNRQTFLSDRAVFPDMKLAPSSSNQPKACPIPLGFSFDFRRQNRHEKASASSWIWRSGRVTDFCPPSGRAIVASLDSPGTRGVASQHFGRRAGNPAPASAIWVQAPVLRARAPAFKKD